MRSDIAEWPRRWAVIHTESVVSSADVTSSLAFVLPFPNKLILISIVGICPNFKFKRATNKS